MARVDVCNSCKKIVFMNISYKWLKDYIDFDMTPQQLAAALTSEGLECDGVETVDVVRGGLRGLVVGKVLTCEAHPDSDHLHVTTVDLGGGVVEQIVCGAPNVAAGQSVIVATVGTTLYDGDKAGMTILLGNTDDDGNYYACLPGSTMVYTVAAADVSDLLTATAEDMRSETILSLPYEQVKSATLTACSAVYTLEPADVATDTDLEGQEAAEDPGEDLWTLVLGLTAAGEPEGSAGDLVLSIHVTSDEGMEATLTIAEYDADSYQLTMDGRTVLVSADAVDKLVRQVKQLAK